MHNSLLVAEQLMLANRLIVNIQADATEVALSDLLQTNLVLANLSEVLLLEPEVENGGEKFSCPVLVELLTLEPAHVKLFAILDGDALIQHCLLQLIF